MNVRLLSRQFPQLAQLPEKQQAAILQQAHERAYAPENKFSHWRGNVISLVWICAVSLFLALVAGPALGLSRPATGGIIMVVVLPVFMFLRHRQYVAHLRPEVDAILRRTHKTKPAP